MFHCLYYSVTFNESREKMKIDFCCISVIKKHCCTVIFFYISYEVNLLRIVFALDKSIPIGL